MSSAHVILTSDDLPTIVSVPETYATAPGSGLESRRRSVSVPASPNALMTPASPSDDESSFTRKFSHFRDKMSDFVNDENKLHGWPLVRARLPDIVELGKAERRAMGLLVRSPYNEDGDKKQGRHLPALRLPDVPAEDSMIQNAIPYLPFCVALPLAFCNFTLPGSGTLLSGMAGLCCGLPRLEIKEGKRMTALVINALVGISQFVTVLFFLVGWFWSIAWGGLLITHALQYRGAKRFQRQEAAATAALEAFSNNEFLHRSKLQTVLRKDEKGNVTTSGGDDVPVKKSTPHASGF